MLARSNTRLKPLYTVEIHGGDKLYQHCVNVWQGLEGNGCSMDVYVKLDMSSNSR